MIRSLRVINFRQFTHFSLSFRKGNILVGPNNAGKSSILDAFRILESCIRYAYRRNPEIIDINGDYFPGYYVPESYIPIKIGNIANDYSDDDAVLEFVNEKSFKIKIFINHNRRTRFCIEAPGVRVRTSSSFRQACGVNFVVIPPLSPLEIEEKFVEEETIRRNEGSRVSSRHLRNVWYRSSHDEFKLFSAEVSSAWENITLRMPELSPGTPPAVYMYYTEGRIDREVSCAGFGFQIWLQILTHLRRVDDKSILIIDEPDIYLHPDLQKRLLRTIGEKCQQFIMATHSVEIINDADLLDIVSISKNYKSGKRIVSDEDYSKLHRYIGSSENTDFARLARAKKVIFVEGKDAKIIRRIAKQLKLKNLSDTQSIPIIQLGGFSQWKRARDAVWAFKNVLSLEIDAYCLFDRDYRCDEEISQFCDEMKESGLLCDVLPGKEIENHIICLSAITRAVNKRIVQKKLNNREIGIQIIHDLINEIVSDMDEEVRARRASHFLSYHKNVNKRIDDSTIMLSHGKIFSADWRVFEKKILMVPGKELISRVNESLQSRYQVTISDISIIDATVENDYHGGFLQIMRRLEDFCS